MQTKINNIVKNPNTGKYYKLLLANIEKQTMPHQTFNSIWDKYNKTNNKSNNRNGRIFEYTVCDTLAHHGVDKLYYQCTFWSMPHDHFDIGGWAKANYPIIISCKTSIRERWKQAEMEGRLLKGIFPRTKSYMIMYEETEAVKLQERIDNETAEGIDKVYLAQNSEFDEFVEELKTFELVESQSILPLKGTLF